ncbi:translation initiation factor IF-5A [Candidatus Woesearchaeota archaeon]|nr:translation initiation factor IF-5A [Candidatus Woesearchaeota archaeon]
MGGEVKRKIATAFTKGNYIVMDGVASVVTDIQTSRPGKHGHAKCNIMAVGMVDGKKRQIVVPGHDELETPVIEKKNAQILNVNGDMASVMDSETYETFDMAIPEELKSEVKEGVTVVYWLILEDRVMKQIKTG